MLICTPKATEAKSARLNTSILKDYMREQFPSLPGEMSEDTALRAVTHKSIAGAAGDHQSRLSFLGRRTLRFQLMMHFMGSGRSVSNDVFRCLDTPSLGDSIGRDWGLEKVMRFSTSQENGIYKVRGSTVEALIGAISHEFGQDVANKIFQSKILPKLNLPESASSSSTTTTTAD